MSNAGNFTANNMMIQEAAFLREQQSSLLTEVMYRLTVVENALERHLNEHIDAAAVKQVNSTDVRMLLECLAAGNKKIEAIKWYRVVMSVPLKDAKEAVERFDTVYQKNHNV